MCTSLVSLLDRAGAHMLPSLQQLTDFFLHTCERDTSTDVVLAACEYWSALCVAAAFNDDDVKEFIIALMPRCVCVGSGAWMLSVWGSFACAHVGAWWLWCLPVSLPVVMPCTHCVPLSGCCLC